MRLQISALDSRATVMMFQKSDRDIGWKKQDLRILCLVMAVVKAFLFFGLCILACLSKHRSVAW